MEKHRYGIRHNKDTNKRHIFSENAEDSKIFETKEEAEKTVNELGEQRHGKDNYYIVYYND